MYDRINKATARKLYNLGETIYLVPCKCVFFAPEKGGFNWITPFSINIKRCEETENQFDRTINSYMYYNCNAELGYYPHYYVQDILLEKYKKKFS